ncbi:MAG: glycoside hydrolase family 13 protein [Lachnospiraceae bacterium]|nr:glycoside hydrolase family 13 protein [Lachnospiraceae bacterium]
MNRCAIQHIVDSSYCFPVAPNEIVLRLRTAKNDISRAQVIYESKYVIGQTQKTADMRKAYTGELFDFYEVRLSLEDTRLAYVFYINDGEKNFYFSEDGVTENYDFALGFYNFFQYPYINQADIMECVPWMKQAVFYQIFVDRFRMGNKEKDTSYINCRWGDIPTPKTFAGGDIRGITEKLDYIKELGCNAVYLTPVFTSVSNHKYDISDYYRVDPQFGTNEDLKELVDAAHTRGMRVVLDAVFNHCSENLAQFQDVLKKGKESPYFDWFVIRGDRINQQRDNYETFAACDYMPKLNTSNEEVQEFLMDIGTHYLTEYDIDGWRLDVSDEISHYFWRKFRERMKKVKRDAVIIGENWHDAANYLRGDQYDSIMNYAFTKLCLDYFAWGSKNAEQAAWKLNELLMRNIDPVNTMMLNLLDSHDTHRFFKETGRNRWKVKAALALLFLFPGVPCIFYGTEILTEGGYDPDCRRCMDWEKANPKGEYSDIYRLIESLSRLRREQNTAEGRIGIYAESDVLVLKNETDERKIKLFVNNTAGNQTVDSCDVSPYSFRITLNGGTVLYEQM